MSAIAKISSALSYDDVESAIMVSFALACAVAVQAAENAAIEQDVSPESRQSTVCAETVRPGR